MGFNSLLSIPFRSSLMNESSLLPLRIATFGTPLYRVASQCFLTTANDCCIVVS